MAKDVITRFKLETTAFDSAIKQASKELSDYSKTATKAKEGFNQFTKANVDAARALGTMATSSNNLKGKLQELVGAYNEGVKAYKALSDEHKESDWAKALAGSLTQLQQRIKETKQEMQGLGDSMKGGGGGIFDALGGKLDGMLQVFGGNVMTKVAGMATGLVTEMGDAVKQGIELARQGEGIRIAFERLGRGDILQGLREATHGTVTDLELMKAAVQFNDFKLPLDQLGTMLAFAQQKAKDTGQSVDYLVQSIVTGLGRKSLMILDNLGLSASEIKEKMAETGDMTKAVGEIIREQMSKAGDYVETAADRAAQANVSLQNKMEELGRKFAPVEEASNQLWTSMKIGILDVVGGPLARLLNGLTEAGRMMNAYGKMGGSGKVGRMISNLAGAREGNRQSIYQQQQAKIWDYINRRENYMKDRQRWVNGGGQNEDLRQILIAQAKSFGTSNVNDIKAQIDAAKKMLSEYQQAAKQYLNPVKADIDTKGAEQNVESLKVKLIELQAQRKKAIAAGDTDLSKNLAKQISQVKSDIKGMGGSTTSKGRSNTKKEQTELQQNQKRINDLTQKYVDLMSEASRESKPLTNEQRDRAASIRKEIRDLERRNGQLKLYQEQAKGKLLGSGAFKQQLEVDVAVNNKKIEELERQLINLDGITIDPKTVTITATDEALPKLREIQGITIDEKTVAITADDKTQPEFREVEGIRLKGKKVTVTADTMEALRAVQGINGVTIDPKTVNITATDEALPKLREIEGITIDDKTMTVTADTQEALQALQGIDGVTVDTKTVKVTAETDEARQKVEELKRQIAELKDQNLMINAGMASLDLQNARDLSRTGGVTGFVGTGKSMTTIEGLPSMSDVVRQRGGNLLDDKAMKAVNEDIGRNLPKDNETDKRDDPLKEAKKQNQYLEGIGSDISGMLSGLEKMGIEIPEGLSSVVGGIQMISGIVSSILALVGVISALTSVKSVPIFGWLLAQGGIAGGLGGRHPIHAAGGTVVGNTYSGDQIPAMLNAGEVVLNRAQQGNIASQLESGAFENLKLDAVISGEQIRMVLNNNGRRTGRGEYVTSNRR